MYYMTQQKYKYSAWKWWETENEKLLPKLMTDGTIEHYMIKKQLPLEDTFVKPDIIIRYATINIGSIQREFHLIVDSKFYKSEKWVRDNATDIFAQMGKYAIALQNFMNPKTVSIDTVVSMPTSTCQVLLRALAKERQINTFITKDLVATINRRKYDALELEKQYQND